MRSRSWWSVLATFGVFGLALAYLAWPFVNSMQVATEEQVRQEAPYVTAALAIGLVAIAGARWLDDQRRSGRLAVLVALIALNVLVALAISPRSSGVDLAYVLPLLTGAAVGGPAGFLVGAASQLVASGIQGALDPTMAGNMLAWGSAGLLGWLVSKAPAFAAWAASTVLGLVAGQVAAYLLVLSRWPGAGGDQPDSFVPGLPATENLQRLLMYGYRHLFGTGLARGAVIGAVVLLIGFPIIRAIRHAWGLAASAVDESSAITTCSINPTAIERRRKIEDRTPVWQLGNQQ